MAGQPPAVGRFPPPHLPRALPRQSCPRLLPLLGIVHEEEVEQPQPGLRQPGELVLEVVVGLLPQGVLTHQGQPGETLRGTEREGKAGGGGRAGGAKGGTALTGQMFSLGVPRSCTMRSIWWISEVPGSSGLWASSSARMQPTALRSRQRARASRGRGNPSVTPPPRVYSPPGPAWAPSCLPLTTCQCWWSGSSSPATAQALGTCMGDSTVSRGPWWSRHKGSPHRAVRSHPRHPQPVRLSPQHRPLTRA